MESINRKKNQIMKYEEFENNIIKWAEQREMLESNIQEVATKPILDELLKSKQLNKLIEEVGELAEDFNKRDASEEHHKHLVDSVGDTLVTLVIFAKQNGLSMEECWNKAWSHIASRQGEMVNGTWVKKQDQDEGTVVFSLENGYDLNVEEIKSVNEHEVELDDGSTIKITDKDYQGLKEIGF